MLAVAGGAPPPADAILHLEAAERDWRRGDKAVAAIRLAFAPVAKLADAEAAYRLFLAEQALAAGLDPSTMLRAFGLHEVAALLKFDRDQPRVPKGSGRESGQFGNKPAASSTGANGEDVRSSNESEATIQPAFFDPHRTATVEKPDAPLFDTTHHFQNPNLKEEGLDPLLMLLPMLALVYPFTETKTEDDEDGLDCPVMRPDRPSSNNAAGQWEEFRLSLLVNPSSPTPKRTPLTPDVTSMAYYLGTGRGDQEVAIDDCKRTSEPSMIPDLNKGDMVEAKTIGAASLVLKDFPNNTASAQYNGQFQNQYDAITVEGKGRRLFQCVGSLENAEALRARFPLAAYPNARFLVCS